MRKLTTPFTYLLILGVILLLTMTRSQSFADMGRHLNAAPLHLEDLSDPTPEPSQTLPTSFDTDSVIAPDSPNVGGLDAPLSTHTDRSTEFGAAHMDPPAEDRHKKQQGDQPSFIPVVMETLMTTVSPEGISIPNLTVDVINRRNVTRVIEPETGFLRYHMSIILRRDLFWSDGSQLTADDVAFSYMLTKTADPDHPLYMYQNPDGWSVVKEALDRVDVIDDSTVRLVLYWMPTEDEIRDGYGLMPIFQKDQWKDFQKGHAGTPTSLVTIDGEHNFSVREHERIIFFENGAVAISNPVTGFTYTTTGVGGDVRMTIDRHQISRIGP